MSTTQLRLNGRFLMGGGFVVDLSEIVAIVPGEKKQCHVFLRGIGHPLALETAPGQPPIFAVLQAAFAVHHRVDPSASIMINVIQGETFEATAA